MCNGRDRVGSRVLVAALVASTLAIGAWPNQIAAQVPARPETQTQTTTQPSVDLAFRKFLEGLWPEAEAAKVSRTTFDKAFQGVSPDMTLPDLVIPGREEKAPRGQAEFTRTPQEYVARGQILKLAEQGRELGQRHARALDEVERRVGVDRAIVLAIWGRETAFGAHKSPHYAIRVLATQAYTGRRKDMFRQELIFALRLLQDRILTPDTMRSSWAGAMGLTQFMPSEFYSSAIDLDGDGRIDLFNSVPDALGSAARQLKLKGWVKGLPWGFEVRPGRMVDCANEGPANAKPIMDWVGLGVVRADAQPFPHEHMRQPAYLMSPAGTHGPQFLVTENFKVLRAYNTSDLYALFVGHLSDRISGAGDFRTPWAPLKQLSAREIEEIQRRLGELGHPMDKIDGKIGSNTRWQIGLYQRAKRLGVDCWPTETVLNHIRAAGKR